MKAIYARIEARIAKFDKLSPEGYPATYQGLRLCHAFAEDELKEVFDAWHEERCKCPTPNCNHATWDKMADEIVDTVAVLLRGLRSIEAARERRVQIQHSGVPPELVAVLTDVYLLVGIQTWWGALNQALDWQRPSEVWETNPDRVMQVACQLRDGGMGGCG